MPNPAPFCEAQLEASAAPGQTKAKSPLMAFILFRKTQPMKLVKPLWIGYLNNAGIGANHRIVDRNIGSA